MAQEEAVGLGTGKYVFSIVVGVVLVSASVIISASRIYVPTAEPLYKHLGFASSIVNQIGVMFVTLPLIIGGIVRDDFHLWIRVAMIVMGCLLLGARFA